MGWRPEDDESIRTLALKGYSASQIGAELGRTRAAVIGRASRRKIPLSETNLNEHKKRPGTKNSRQSAARKLKRVAARQELAVKKTIECKAPPSPACGGGDYSHCVHLLDLTNANCRWPMWPDAGRSNQMFCGQEKHLVDSYCPYHMRVSEKGFANA